MTFQHDNPENRPFRRYAMATLKIIAVVSVLAVLTHVSWNLFAPGLFDLPRVRMKEALGLVGFGGLLSFMLRHAIRGGRHG